MEVDTRRKILDVATELFANKGFAGVSVREVTKEAEINVSAISYHFSSKEGLYQAVLKEQLSPILASLEHIREQTDLTPLQRLRYYADQIAKVHVMRPLLSKFMSGEVTTPTGYGGPIIREHLSRVYQMLTATLQQGVDQGLFRKDLQITYAAISLAGIVNFFFITKPIIETILPLSEQSNQEYTDHAFELYLQGIQEPKG